MALATYGTQFRTIPSETEEFISTAATGGVVFNHVKVDGREISGPEIGRAHV